MKVLLIGGNTCARASRRRALDWRQYLRTSKPPKSSGLAAIPAHEHAAEELLIGGNI
jgi:hypothetical protein